MDDKLAKQLIRQLKLLNFWITLFGIVMLVGFAIIGYLLWQVISFANETRQNFEDTKESFNIQQQVCSGEGSFSDFVRRSGACQ